MTYIFILVNFSHYLLKLFKYDPPPRERAVFQKLCAAQSLAGQHRGVGRLPVPHQYFSVSVGDKYVGYTV